MGRRLPKYPCPKCKRLISIMSNVTRNKLRDHKCVPVEPTPPTGPAPDAAAGEQADGEER